MGDSYAAGIGAGASQASYLCFRFDGAYGNLLQNALEPRPAIFNWPACCGDTFEKMIDYQFVETTSWTRPGRGVWGESPSVVTLSLGGNDIGFKELVTRCIYGIPGFTWIWNSCADVIAESQKRVNDPSFLDNGVFNVIAKALSVASEREIPNFKLYVLGYAQFFNATTTQCNDVHGLPAPSSLALQEPSYLTEDLRNSLNQIALDLNTGIQAAVLRAATLAPGQVIYVPIDDLYNGHRFCDRTEPNSQDPDTWFLTYDTDPPTATNAQALASAVPALVTNPTTNGGTARNASEFLDYFGTLPSSNNSQALDGIADLAKVFHPKAAGHAAIQQRLYGLVTGVPAGGN